MKLVRLISITLTLFIGGVTVFAKSPDCQAEFNKFCGPGEKATDCIRKNGSKFSSNCVSELVDATWSQDNSHEKCQKEFDKFCGAENTDPDCLTKNRSKFSLECQVDESRMGGEFAAGLDACQKDVEKLCKLDEAALEKDPVKAAKDYEECVLKNLSKSSDACKKGIGLDKVEETKKETEKQKEEEEKKKKDPHAVKD
jgi:hypothetical protein